MTTEEKIKTLITQGENTGLEFKRAVYQLAVENGKRIHLEEFGEEFIVTLYF